MTFFIESYELVSIDGAITFLRTFLGYFDDYYVCPFLPLSWK